MYIINKMSFRSNADEWEENFDDTVRKVRDLYADIDTNLRSNEEWRWNSYVNRWVNIKDHLRTLKNSYPEGMTDYKYNDIQEMIVEPMIKMQKRIRGAVSRITTITRSRTRDSVRPGGSRKRTGKRKSSKQGQTKRKQTKRRQSRI
jgi:hypothetical protein